MERPLVLAVDDDEGMRYLYMASLKARGFDVVVAADPAEALELLRSTTPDAVVLDMIMTSEPEDTSIIDTLRGEERTRNIPIVVVSGVTPGHSRYRVGGGWDLYMTKPVHHDELALALRELIGNLANPI